MMTQTIYVWAGAEYRTRLPSSLAACVRRTPELPGRLDERGRR